MRNCVRASDKLIDHEHQCRKERENAKRGELNDKHKSLHFMDAAPAIRCQFMELGNRSSAKVQSNYWIWNDSNYYYFADDLFERPASNFSTPRRASWQVVSKIVRVVCTAIIWHLGPVNIKLPFTENEMKKLVAQKLMLFHNVLGQ